MFRFVFLAILTVALLLRIYVVFQTDFPINQGGMFYEMTRDLIANDFVLPKFTTYNHANIPFAYSPLSFYLVGGLHVLGLDLLTLFKFVPFLVSMVCVVCYYIFARRLFPKGYAAHIATFLYICSVSSYISLVEAAGIARAPALLFGFLSLSAMYDAFSHNSRKKAAVAGVLLGVAALFHLETAVFIVYSIGAFYLALSRSVKGVVSAVIAGLCALVVSAPWWVTVMSVHGAQPFINAQQSSPWDLLGLLNPNQASLVRYFSGPLLDPFPTLACFGFLTCFLKRKWLLPLWFVLLYLTASRLFFTTTGIIPIGLMAGYALYEVIFPAITKLYARSRVKPVLVTTGIYALCAVSAIVFFMSTFWHPFTPFHAIDRESRASMKWVTQNTPLQADFLVVTPVPHWMWFLDNMSEWFPALTGRRSIATVQGTEWLPQFQSRLAVIRELQDCYSEGIECLEGVMTHANMDPDYIYIAKPFKLEPEFPSCCDVLSRSLAGASGYRIVYNGVGAQIWQKNRTSRLSFRP